MFWTYMKRPKALVQPPWHFCLMTPFIFILGLLALHRTADQILSYLQTKHCCSLRLFRSSSDPFMAVIHYSLGDSIREHMSPPFTLGTSLCIGLISSLRFGIRFIFVELATWATLKIKWLTTQNVLSRLEVLNNFSIRTFSIKILVGKWRNKEFFDLLEPGFFLF